MTLPAPGAAGSLGANKAIVIDTTGPTVTSVTSSTLDGYYNVPDVIVIQVIFTENVTVTGTPRITLETGGTDAVVDYFTGSGTSTLVFNYTVAAGHNSADLDYTNIAALALNGGTIQDSFLNPATLTLTSPGSAGSLGANKAIVIDTTAPASLTNGGIIAASDTGALNTDAITSDTTPTLEGTGVEANAIVKIYSDVPAASTLVCTTTADGVGNWSCTTGALAIGTHGITGTQTDLAGNESAVLGTLTAIIDNVSPAGSFSTVAFLTNNVAPHVLTFTVADTAIGGGIFDDTDITVSDSVSGALTPSCTPAVAFPTTTNEVVTCTVSISGEGTHVMSVTVLDTAGNS